MVLLMILKILLVIAKFDVEARLMLLDKVIFEKERFLLVVDNHRLDFDENTSEQARGDKETSVIARPEVLPEPDAQILGFADIDDDVVGRFHDVDPRLSRHRLKVSSVGLEQRQLLCVWHVYYNSEKLLLLSVALAKNTEESEQEEAAQYRRATTTLATTSRRLAAYPTNSGTTGFGASTVTRAAVGVCSQITNCSTKATVLAYCTETGITFFVGLTHCAKFCQGIGVFDSNVVAENFTGSTNVVHGAHFDIYAAS